MNINKINLELWSTLVSYWEIEESYYFVQSLLEYLYPVYFLKKLGYKILSVLWVNSFNSD